MPLEAGKRLGHYEVVALIGVGGMGEVYRARDSRLDRTVAIKVLPREQAGRSNRQDRFDLEGRAISSLNHAHICSLFDIGDEAGMRYLVMEYLEGETLHERLKRGPFALRDALAIAIQIGEALDHAHHHGIVHRDLNPSNIMLAGPKGTNAKLLDFGLAKLVERPSSAGELTSVPTQTHLTAEGTIVGTYQYMAPEQLDGKEAGARTDIFAFGAVLYEMISGHKAFAGTSRASIISAVVKDDPPPVSKHQPMSPPALDRMIRKCLAKDPEERWQSARDAVDELKWIVEGGSQAGTPPVVIARRRSRARWGWMLASVLLAAIAGIVALSFTRPSVVSTSTPIRFEVPLPAGMFLGEFDYPELSPDASRLVFPAHVDKGASRLMIRKMDSLDIQPLPGTEGAMFPFWSPDSRWVAFFASGQLKKVDIGGGTPVSICDAQGGIGGAWNRDGVIVFCPRLDSPLQRVDASGGVPVQATRLDSAHFQTSQFFPSFLSDQRHFIFFGVSAGRDGFYGPYSAALDSMEVKPLFNTLGKVSFANPGRIVFPRNDSLMAQAFDERALHAVGHPRLIVEKVGDLGLVAGSAFSVAGSSLAYRRAAPSPALSWLDRAGEKVQSLFEPGDFGNPDLSSDGKTVAVDYRENASRGRDLWLLDAAGVNKTRLTFDGSDNFNPTWSHDRQYIAFTSTRKGVRDIYRKPASGGPEELLYASSQEKNVEDWSSDGKTILFNTRVAGHPIEIWALPIYGDRRPYRVISAATNCEQGRLSPDSKWIAYRRGEAGGSEIYVQEFPPSGGTWQVSNGNSVDPQWRGDGKELYFRQDRKLMAVDVKTGGSRLQLGAPHELFEVRINRSGRSSYVASLDGRRFLVDVAPAETTSTSFTVLSGWPNGLGR